MAAIVPILAVAAVLVILVLLAVKIVWSPLRSTVGPRVKQLASVNGSFSYLRVILVALFFLVFGVLFLIGVAIWALVVNIADNWKYYAWAVALIAGAQLAAEYNADIQLGVTEFYVCGFYKVRAPGGPCGGREGCGWHDTHDGVVGGGCRCGTMACCL